MQTKNNSFLYTLMDIASWYYTMLNHKILLLNGPASSGKDFIADILYKHFNCRKAKFSKPLKDATRALFLLHDEVALEAKKEEYTEAFFHNMTYRQMQIALSEDFLKPRFGKDIFGKLLLRQLHQPTNCSFTVVSDSGFVEEAATVRKHYGKKNVFVLRLEREGTNYAGDSRGYLNLDNSWQTKTFKNNHSKSVMPRIVSMLVADWLDVKPSSTILDREMTNDELNALVDIQRDAR